MHFHHNVQSDYFFLYYWAQIVDPLVLKGLQCQINTFFQAKQQ
jgi:hypothetical protein